MSGPPNMYPGGYPNPQQQSAIRQQFPGTNPMGMMGNPQQQGMMPQQAYSQMQMQQQAMQQQQQQQQQQAQIVPQMQPVMPAQSQMMPQQTQQAQQHHQQQLMQQQAAAAQQQQQQQQSMQQQQQQQGAPQQVPQNSQQQPGQQPQAPTQQVVQPPQPTPPQAPASSQPPQSKEFNTASLCRLGQETVHDIIARAQEVFTTLKTIQPPNGTAQGMTTSNEKKAKVQEQLRTIRLLFKRLRLIYEKCNENCQGMEYTHIESLIPIKEEWDMKSDEKKSSEAYRQSLDENKEIMEQVIVKNRHLKEVIDHMRRIIWEINTMLTMRRS